VFFQGGKCVINVLVYRWLMQRNWALNYRSGGDANLLSLNFYVLLALSTELSVLYYEYPFAFSVISVMP